MLIPYFNSKDEVKEDVKLGDVSIIKSGRNSICYNGTIPLFGSTGKIGYCDSGEYNGRVNLVARVGANTGYNYIINEEKFGVTDNTLLIETTNKLSDKYLHYLLKNYNLNRLSFGSGQPLITASELKNVKFDIDLLKNQRQIEGVLSQIDNLIEHQTQKYHELQSIKICLLNTFFSKDRLVNNQFIPLADFCNGMKSGGTPKATEVRFYGGNIPFMSISDIKGDKLFSTKKFITEAGLNNSSSKIIDSNNIIYTMYATPGIAFTTLIDVAIPQSVISIELKDKSYNYYIKEFLNYSRTDILKFAMTGTQSNLTGEIVKNIKVPLMNIADVEKITYILSQMDNYTYKALYNCSLLFLFRKVKLFLLILHILC